MRKLLLAIALILLFGCARLKGPTVEPPPSPQERCEFGCLDAYSSCILECGKTQEIGAKLDSCVEECKEQWPKCKEDCSK